MKETNGDGACVSDSHAWLNDCETAREIRSINWDDTPLGPIKEWPQPLCTILGIILRSPSEMFLVWGPERNLIYNDTCASFLRHRHPDAVGGPISDVWPELTGEVNPAIERAFRGETAQVDRVQLPQNGSTSIGAHQLQLSLTPILDETGEVAGVLGQCNEIVGRALHFGSQEEDDERLRTALDIEGIGVLYFDEEGTLYDANDTFLRMTGYTREEVTSRTLTWKDLTPPEWMDVSEEQLEKLEETDRIGPYEKEYFCKDGSRSWMLFSGARLSDGTVIEHCIDIGKQKRAEQLLRESEERFRLLLDSAAEGIYGLDTQGNCTFVNNACLDLLGYDSPNELVGRNMHDVIHHTRRDGSPYPEEECEIFKAFRKGEPTHLDNEVLWRKDGTSFYAEYWSHPITQEGEIVGAVVSFLDITERKAAEEALRKREQHFRNMADSAPAVLWVTDKENRANFLSKQWYETTGQTKDEALEFSWLNAVHPGDREEAKRIFLAAAEEQQPFSIDYRLRQSDGSYRWTIDKGEPWFDDDGDWCGYVGTILDVHERRLATEALRESEERYRTLFNSIEEGFCVLEIILNEDGEPVNYKFVEANPAFGRHTGLEDAIGKTALEMVPDLENDWIDLYGKVALTGEPVQFTQESESMGKSFDVQAFPVGGEESLRVGLVFEDITERKQAQEALKEMNEELEARVDERTEQVRRLALKLTEAEQKERRRIAQILHDDLQQLLFGIKFKLASVSGGLQEHEHGGMNDMLNEARSWLDRAVKTSRQLTRDISPPVLDTDGLTAKLEWLQSQMDELHDLDVRIEAEHNFCESDKELSLLLFQVVRELLFNARKHAGVDRVDVKLFEDDGFIVIHVIDEGDGFDVDEVMNGDENNGGFGLTSVQERLQLVGGHLKIDSAPGEGTCIQVYARL